MVARVDDDMGPTVRLTPAEERVLFLLPTWLSVRQMAERLFLSKNTVKTHMIAVYRKLGVDSRGAAVEKAIAMGLLRSSGWTTKPSTTSTAPMALTMVVFEAVPEREVRLSW